MGNLLNRIEELIPCLPGKDVELAKKYLKERNFESVFEIVDSDIYKIINSIGKGEPLSDEYMSSLLELRNELLTYMSYLGITRNSSDYDDY